MKIKPLTPNHIEEILQLDKRFQSQWSEEFYLERMELFPHFALGAFIDDKLIGFIMGKIKINNERDIIFSEIIYYIKRRFPRSFSMNISSNSKMHN